MLNQDAIQTEQQKKRLKSLALRIINCGVESDANYICFVFITVIELAHASSACVRTLSEAIQNGKLSLGSNCVAHSGCVIGNSSDEYAAFPTSSFSQFRILLRRMILQSTRSKVNSAFKYSDKRENNLEVNSNLFIYTFIMNAMRNVLK
jgi:hypothetical protein